MTIGKVINILGQTATFIAYGVPVSPERRRFAEAVIKLAEQHKVIAT